MYILLCTSIYVYIYTYVFYTDIFVDICMHSWAFKVHVSVHGGGRVGMHPARYPNLEGLGSSSTHASQYYAGFFQ